MADPGNYQTKSLYLRILGYLRPYARLVFVVFFFNFSFIIFNTLSIWMVAPFIGTLFQSQTTEVKQEQKPLVPEEKKDISVFNLNEWLKSKTDHLIHRKSRTETLKVLCIFIFLSFLLKNAFRFGEAYWVSYVEQGVIKKLRDEVYEHILRQPLDFFQQYQTGNLISRVTNDINSLNLAVNRSFTKIIRDPIVIIIFLGILFSISWQLTLVAFVVVPVSGILIRKIGQSLKRKSRRVQERLADITTILQETIYGIKVVKAFAMEDYENRKFRESTNRHFRSVLRQVRLNRLSSPLSETLGVGIMVSVLWFGGQLVLNGQLLNSEDFIRFILILFAIMDPIKSLGDFNNNVQTAMASGKRIFEIIDRPVAVQEKPGAVEKKSFEKNICYHKVSFRYEEQGEWVLQNINLTVNKFEKIALVGSSGAGKTTLVNLLARFYDVSSGAIRIDGIDIRDMTLNSLRHLMGIVTQEVILFNDTVANNIAYGVHGYSREEIEHAARLANALDFIKQMPNGFDTMIGERGMRLSGGEKQRISIARAILKNPPILIFDEATSSLDSEAEYLIQEAINNLMQNRTVLMIAHRLSSIINSDKIFVLEKGHILDEGTHEELLKRSQRYRHLHELQFAG